MNKPENTEDTAVNLSSLDLGSVHGSDRGALSLEELESQMTPEALALVDQMEQATIDKFEENKRKEKKVRRHFYRRRRVAWDRMNRKHRLEIAERGMQRIYNLIAGKGFVVDPEPEKTGEAEDTEASA